MEELLLAASTRMAPPSAALTTQALQQQQHSEAPVPACVRGPAPTTLHPHRSFKSKLPCHCSGLTNYSILYGLHAPVTVKLQARSLHHTVPRLLTLPFHFLFSVASLHRLLCGHTHTSLQYFISRPTLTISFQPSIRQSLAPLPFLS